ncbi:hypothetical protein MHYP_G00322440 [Metynnis hypsauchen]
MQHGAQWELWHDSTAASNISNITWFPCTVGSFVYFSGEGTGKANLKILNQQHHFVQLISRAPMKRNECGTNS